MTFSHITHHMGRREGSQQSVVTRVTPIVRLGFGSEVIFLQAGNFYDASGKMYDEKDIPGWVRGEMTKLSDDSLKSVGFKRPDAKPSTPESTALVEWQCPECGKMMDERNKEPHLAKHARKAPPQTKE